MKKEIIQIQDSLKSLINGNWANDNIGRLEEIEKEVELIGNLLTFTISVLIHQKVLDINTFKKEHKSGWKIDYK